jgi:putative nucleotidyltransferase with HDIG domain
MNKENHIDVLDSNYPLIIKLKETAPGTYNHSRAVASLLEAIAIAIDLPDELLKIAGFYHDIGKTVSPKMFIENQQEEDENPHDKLEPHVSLRYITAHVGDTAQILINDRNIPVEVIRWCIQHHGTSVIKSVFLKKQKSGEAKRDNYRYPCKKPECLEAALIMICDILEATSRALSQSGQLISIDELVEKVIQDLEQDEQLDDVELTFGKLRIIKNVLKKELSAQYHKRINYKDTPELLREKK